MHSISWLAPGSPLRSDSVHRTCSKTWHAARHSLRDIRRHIHHEAHQRRGQHRRLGWGTVSQDGQPVHKSSNGRLLRRSASESGSQLEHGQGPGNDSIASSRWCGGEGSYSTHGPAACSYSRVSPKSCKPLHPFRQQLVPHTTLRGAFTLTSIVADITALVASTTRE